jgi:hypothetical protein
MNYLRRRQSFLALALVACIVFTACPTQSQLDKAARASNDIARYTGEAIAVTKTMFESGMINLAKKDQIAAQLLNLSHAGKNFNDLVIKLSKDYPTGSIPPTAWQLLSQNFDSISRGFIQLLDVISGVNPQLGNSKAMRVIRAAVLSLAVLLQAQGINSPEIRRWA